MKYYLGLDIGSISTNLTLIDEKGRIVYSLYFRTEGNPIRSVQKAVKDLKKEIRDRTRIYSIGITGSGRELVGRIINADVIKNEITAHAVGTTFFYPEVNTIIEIGGQDSKIIIIRDGVVVDFAMNTLCAAGTGSFLDSQAQRLRIPIEKIGNLAVKSLNPINIAGRCSVFAESDIIHKQQMGYRIEDILMGVCRAMVRNYMSNVAKGKEIIPPIVFQGGVSENQGIKKALADEFEHEIIVPEHNKIMGAFGAALIARRTKRRRPRSFDVFNAKVKIGNFECNRCPNSCEIVEACISGKVVGRWGSRCGRWR